MIERWLRRRVPVKLQMDATECGAACLAMILGYHGHETSVRDCRARCGIGRDGMTADVLVRTARGYGLVSRAISAQGTDLSGVRLPAIVHWNFAHFVVLERWQRDYVDVVDPASGRVRMTAAEFEAGFTGIALMFEPGPEFVSKRETDAVTWRRYLLDLIAQSGVRGALGQLLIASLALQAFGLAVPLLTGFALDRVLPRGLHDAATALGLAILAFVAAQVGTIYLRSRLLLFVEAKLDASMMPRFFRHLLSLPCEFFLRHRNGDLLMRLGNNAVIRDALAHQTLSMALDGAMVVIYLAALLIVDVSLGAVVVAIALVQVAISLAAAAALRRRTDREINAMAASHSYASEALNAIASVKASGVEDRLIGAWCGLFHRYRSAALERSELAATVDSMIAGLRLLAPVPLLWFGLHRVLDSTLSAGSLVSMNMFAAALLVPLSSLLSAAQRIRLAKVHLDRVLEINSTEPEQQPGTGRPAPKLSGRIELRDVAYGYDPRSAPVVRNIDLVVEPGQKVALVGRTGCGKTTLAQLMLGLVNPTHGDIYFDGVNLRDLDRRSLRQQFGVVLQDAGLFSGSVRQNIAFFDSAVTFPEVLRAAKLAQIHDDIVAMPMAYETRLADGGAGLSGGQRQRLCVARALARRPAILLLDEATSHLDVATEKALDEALDSLECTRIVIAHRMSTIRNADKIVVMSDGRIADCGTHDELLERCSQYATLVQSQADEVRRAKPWPAPVSDAALRARG